MDKKLTLEVVKAEQLTPTLLKEILALCSQAFEEEMEPLFETFKDAVHVVGFLDKEIVSHALWVTRWLQVDFRSPNANGVYRGSCDKEEIPISWLCSSYHGTCRGGDSRF